MTGAQYVLGLFAAASVARVGWETGAILYVGWVKAWRAHLRPHLCRRCRSAGRRRVDLGWNRHHQHQHDAHQTEIDAETAIAQEAHRAAVETFFGKRGGQ